MTQVCSFANTSDAVETPQTYSVSVKHTRFCTTVFSIFISVLKQSLSTRPSRNPPPHPKIRELCTLHVHWHVVSDKGTTGRSFILKFCVTVPNKTEAVNMTLRFLVLS